MNRIIGNTYIDNSTGYIYFCDKSHPLCHKNGKTALHRHLASQKLGRWLTNEEQVHHLDGNKLNNSLDNLEVLSIEEHARVHFGTKILENVTCPICNLEFMQKEKDRRFCSHDCAYKSKVKHPALTKEELQRLIDQKVSWVALGRLYSMSDNGIKKRAKSLGCIFSTRVYKIPRTKD